LAVKITGNKTFKSLSATASIKITK
jgi:hypothetical protein